MGGSAFKMVAATRKANRHRRRGTNCKHPEQTSHLDPCFAFSPISTSRRMAAERLA
jgi:hypothetical protein